MKLIAKDNDFAVLDEVFEPSIFTNFWTYYNQLDFAYRSMTGWCKVWRINDGQILAGAPFKHTQAPFNCPMDWVHKTIFALAGEHFSSIVGSYGKDWSDILLTPYIYPVGTRISWHDDFAYTGACIFYAHPKWNPHWGGELMLAKTPPEEELNKIKNSANAADMMTRDYLCPIVDYYGMGRYIAPMPNRMVFTRGDLWHSINRVDQAAGDNMRCSVVAFFLKN